jgi:hypothetical protein
VFKLTALSNEDVADGVDVTHLALQPDGDIVVATAAATAGVSSCACSSISRRRP